MRNGRRRRSDMRTRSSALTILSTPCSIFRHGRLFRTRRHDAAGPYISSQHQWCPPKIYFKESARNSKQPDARSLRKSLFADRPTPSSDRLEGERGWVSLDAGKCPVPLTNRSSRPPPLLLCAPPTIQIVVHQVIKTRRRLHCLSHLRLSSVQYLTA